jgi:hypothetical protein
LLGELPQLGRDWLLRQQEATNRGGYEYSWATFTNSKTGDILSFAADRYTNGVVRTVRSAPSRQAAIDMFPAGLPLFMPKGKEDISGWRIVDTLRFNTIALETGVLPGLKNQKTEALEYSYVYENEDKKHSNLLAHGYVMAFGDTVVFVQQTSIHVIESTDVNSIALSLIRTHQ